MTDYLTILALRNRHSGRGVRPRLPARFEPGMRNGTAFTAGPAEKGLTTAVHRFILHQPGELSVEEIEREEIAGSSGPGFVTRPVARGLPAFAKTARPAAPRGSPVQEKVPVGRGTEQPEPEEPVASEKVRRQVSAPKKPGKTGERRIRTVSPQKISEQDGKVKPATVRHLPEADAEDAQQDLVPERKGTKTVTGKKKTVTVPVVTAENHTPPQVSRQSSDPGLVPIDRRERTFPEKIPVIRAKSLPAALSGMERIITPGGIRPFSQEPWTGSRTTMAQEPRIQVTIGCIEVRSVPRKEAREHRQTMPDLDLSEYLQHTARKAVK